MKPVEARGDYVGGTFVPQSPDAADGVIVSVSARDTADEVGRFPWRRDAVDAAVAAAREAQPAWARMPAGQRFEALRRLRDRLTARAEDLARLMCRELGKPLWEARTEAKACAAKVDVTLDEGMALVAPVRPSGLAGGYAFKPHGVLSIIGPFNFPVHLANGHVVPALATGNTVVVKPSEVTPAVGQLYAEIVAEADLPPGVFNLVQGEGPAGAHLAAHPGVDGVLFTGSYDVGRRIQEATLDQPWKVLALELGGKNPALVLEDTDLDKAVHDVLWAAYVTCGQRCSATSRAIVHASIADAFVTRLAEKARKIVVGDPMQDGVFMGPLATEAAREKFLSGVAAGEAEGAETILRAEALDHDPAGWYVTPGIHRIHQIRDASRYQREELFGPDVAVYTVGDLDEAVALANGVDYGLAASVFTKDRARFEHAHARLAFGCINWNAPTCGASSRLPFGGVKKSGNHRPAALFSTLYCAYPVATLEGPAALDTSKLSPGLSW
jgi:succinylglutamic semialdehyde dehydrogenase